VVKCFEISEEHTAVFFRVTELIQVDDEVIRRKICVCVIQNVWILYVPWAHSTPMQCTISKDHHLKSGECMYEYINYSLHINELQEFHRNPLFMFTVQRATYVHSNTTQV